MRVETLGRGEPQLAIVGAIHGDEPCGAQAIETLLAAEPDVDRPVKLITANERALTQDERYVDVDMNRVFPGSPTADAHEQQLAAQLLDELRGCLTLSLHSTHSDERPFAIVNDVSPLAMDICPYLSVTGLVETGDLIENTLVHHTPVIEIECGFQGTEQAATNAVQLVHEFLAVTGALSAPSVEQHPLGIYQLTKQLPKERTKQCDVLVENFEPVSPGTPYATVESQAVVADQPFYPVLMSATGYESQFGYAAELVGTLG